MEEWQSGLMHRFRKPAGAKASHEFKSHLFRMVILSIETSCDETAVSVVRAEGQLESPRFTILGNALYSQTAIHSEYGGVYPNLAKREHAKNLVPLFEKALSEAGLISNFQFLISNEKEAEIKKILEREQGLEEQLTSFLRKYDKPPVDMIAVTAGPGLEPALWVGIQFAKALGLAWNIPIVPTNHMEGHIASVLLQSSSDPQILNLKSKIIFPAVALLISGGHTEIVLVEHWGTYDILGETRDDAVGEAFDKVARMLGLPYPGGPAISALAEEAIQQRTLASSIHLPRPMIHSEDLDFSFSGLKTAVLYTIRDIKTGLTDATKAEIAREFEDAAVDVLISKTERALIEANAKTLIIAGGVIANKKIREAFSKLISEKYPEISFFMPTKELSTDNSVMIAMAAYIEILVHPELLKNTPDFRAEGNLKL